MIMEPTGVNLNQNAQAAIMGSILSTWALAVIAVILRFISRRIARAGFWVDDWLMLPALAICTFLTFVAGVWRKCVSLMLKSNLAKTAMILRNRIRLWKAYSHPAGSSSVFGGHASGSLHCRTLLPWRSHERQRLYPSAILATLQAQGQNSNLRDRYLGLVLGNCRRM